MEQFLQRRKLIGELVRSFGSDLLVLSGNGVASLLLSRSKAPAMLKLTDNTSDFYMTSIAKMIKRECSLDYSNTALVIGNIITSFLTNRLTTLQITIGTLKIKIPH